MLDSVIWLQYTSQSSPFKMQVNWLFLLLKLSTGSPFHSESMSTSSNIPWSVLPPTLASLTLVLLSLQPYSAPAPLVSAILRTSQANFHFKVFPTSCTTLPPTCMILCSSSIFHTHIDKHSLLHHT